MTDPTKPDPTAKQGEQNSTETIVLGCKLPHGIILELPNRKGKRYTLRGTNAARIVGGYGITPGIPKSFWDEWLTLNGDHPAVRNGSVFPEKNVERAEAKAKEMRRVRTGLEPIDPLKPPKGIVVDDKGKAELAKQRAENPDRNKQQRE